MLHRVQHDEDNRGQQKKKRHPERDSGSHDREKQQTDAASSLPAAGRCSMTKERATKKKRHPELDSGSHDWEKEQIDAASGAA